MIYLAETDWLDEAVEPSCTRPTRFLDNENLEIISVEVAGRTVVKTTLNVTAKQVVFEVFEAWSSSVPGWPPM